LKEKLQLLPVAHLGLGWLLLKYWLQRVQKLLGVVAMKNV